MAGGMDLGAGGRGKKRPLDAAINLVPFIDLMAVLISFLLLTAAWNQTGRMTARQGGAAGGDGPEVIPVNVLVTANQLRVSLGGTVIDLAVARDDRGRLKVDALEDKLREVHAQLHQRELNLLLADEVPYDDLVHVMDTCIGSGFDEVQVTPVM